MSETPNATPLSDTELRSITDPDILRAMLRESQREIDRLRASARGETTAEGERAELLRLRKWYDEYTADLIGQRASHSRDAAIGAALRAVVDQIASRGNVWVVVSRFGVHIEEARGAVTCNNETAALASQLRAVSTGEGT